MPSSATIWFSVEENPNPAEGEEPITHSPKIAVVDQSGKIVGLYSSSDAAQIDQLKRRVEQNAQVSLAIGGNHTSQRHLLGVI